MHPHPNLFNVDPNNEINWFPFFIGFQANEHENMKKAEKNELIKPVFFSFFVDK